MTGRDHMIANISTTAVLADISFILKNYEGRNGLIKMFADINEKGMPYFTSDSCIRNGIIFLFLSLMCFIIGTFLPDADSRTSVMGRIIHLPGGHRTWTHSAYTCLLWLFVGYNFHPFMWLFLAHFLHVFYDSLSRGGVCWFLPFTGYRKFGNSGAKIKNGHFWGYRVGTWSEYGLIICLIMTAVFTTYITIKAEGIL